MTQQTLSRMPTTIQWRLKPKFRRVPEHANWRKYAEVKDDEITEKLASYNENDPHFEYREAPKAKKDDE